MVSDTNNSFIDSLHGSEGFLYRKILRIDLERDRCMVCASDPEGTQPGGGSFTSRMSQFGLSGAIHPEDVERFITFTRLDHLGRVCAGTRDAQKMVYRRKEGGGYRWHMMELIPDQDNPRYVVMCVKDMDDAFQEGLELESTVSRQALLQSMEDRAYIISSLSSLFFSTYYINLESDTFRTVTQLGRVGDVLGDEVSCSAALSIYANHFVHPDDRPEYLNTMNMKNLRDSLRWWQPSVACEYRRLSGDPSAGLDNWDWVRASVVLARTGEGDLPQTAVYVAQDISGGRRDERTGK